MDDIDNRQESVNEKSYSDLLTGNNKNSSKEPRWYAVKGMSKSINILAGKIEKTKKELQAKSDYNTRLVLQNELDILCRQIEELSDKKAKLKKEIMMDKK